MFNGVPHEQQFHQFIASRTAALPLPLPLTLPLHVSPLPPNFSIHDLQQQPPSSHHQLFQSHLLHPLQRQVTNSTHEVEEKEEREVGGGELELDGVRSASEVMDPWVKEEVLALLTIRSSMGNEFSDFIWNHVSRKLAELGYKRSAEKCKEKFEEVSKYCSNASYGNHSRSFNELEPLFQDHQNQKSCLGGGAKVMRSNEEEKTSTGVNLEENSANETLENPCMEQPQQEYLKRPKKKKRKKQHQVEILKGFSQFVNNVLVQQEELHKKFVEDIERREDERVAREEAWRKKEMDRLNKELEMRAKEQASTCERQIKIIELLNNLATKFPSQSNNESPNTPKTPNPPTSPSKTTAQNPRALYRAAATTSSTPNSNVQTSSTIVLAPQNQITLTIQQNPQVPNSSTLNPDPQNPNPDFTTSSTQLIVLPNPNPNPNPSFTSNEKEDHGKRWPRDEVNSLINLRCNLQNSSEDTKAPLWERISQGMLELGYKRSAKKCKEKWENINKYFRKTKDTNKKRSLDSKTCPYFQQLNNLYTQGIRISPSEGSGSVNQPNQPTDSQKNHSGLPETSLGSSTPHQQGGFSEAMEHVDESEKNMVQVHPLEFEY